MKLRNGFVSNSSSSSFIIKKKYLTKFQICAIRYHLEFGKLFDMECCNECNRWETLGIRTKKSKVIQFGTSMTNFNMREFLKKIGVPDEVIPEEKVWEIRLSGWISTRLIPEGKLEEYIRSLPPDKRTGIVELGLKEVSL